MRKVILASLYCLITTLGQAQDTGNNTAVDQINAACCPPGYVFDGANCHSTTTFPSQYEPFILDNTFYVRPDCDISTDNGCCPPGFTLDGDKCNSGTTFPSGWNPFIFGTAFYVTAECCSCPRGYHYDGANCHSTTTFPSAYEPLIFENAFYVWPDCDISTDNNCCPPGYIFDGERCYSGASFPDGWNPFIFGTAFYVSARCADNAAQDICSVIAEIDGLSDYNETFVMTQTGDFNVCILPRCIPDQVIITINNEVAFDTGSLTTSCFNNCFGEPFENCSAPINSLCETGENEDCYEVSYNAGDVVEIFINNNSCNMVGFSSFSITCEDIFCPDSTCLKTTSLDVKSENPCATCKSEMTYNLYTIEGIELLTEVKASEISAFAANAPRVSYVLQEFCGGQFCKASIVPTINLQQFDIIKSLKR